jgi:succinate-semialdehyde dehydrogenase/glutarate-semialdehyde dehydrogenase
MKLKDPTLLREQCYVNGAWIGAAETEVTNPATGEVIARVPKFGAAETRTAPISSASGSS